MTSTISRASNEVYEQIRSVIGDGFSPLHRPLFKGNELAYVSDTITSGWVSSVGQYVDRFEVDLASFLGVKRCVAVVNGTAAIHLSLVALGIQPKDEVLIPALTFVATANAVVYAGATPHFCDSEAVSLGLCPDKLDEYLGDISQINANGETINKNTGNRLFAVMPMHTLGHPVKMDELQAVADKYNLHLVEDAAESLGSKYKGRYTGGLGKLGAISFNGNKIITTGGGGAIATNDEELADRLKHLSTTAKSSKEGFFHHDCVGYNYRMPNLNAALGCAQIEALPEYLSNKRKLFEGYKEVFKSSEYVSLIEDPDYAESNQWLCSVRLSDPSMMDDLLDKTNSNGVMTRPLWNLINTLPMYQDAPCMNLDVAEKLAASIVSLPSSVDLI